MRAFRASFRSPLFLPLLACLATAVLSALVSPPPTWFALKGDVHRLWIALLLAAAFPLLSPESRRRAAAAFVLGAVVAALIGIGQAVLGRLHGAVWTRAHAFIHPVTFGELIGLAALACAGAWVERRNRPAVALAAAVLVGALILSETRGAVLGFGGGLIALGLAAPGRKRWGAIAVPLTVAALLASDLLGQNANRSLWRQLFGGASAPSSGQTFRFTLWSSAWDMFREKPVTGVGPGNYRIEFPRFSPVGIDGERSAGNAHDLYLHHLAERGILGLGATLWLLAVFWAVAIRQARRAPDALALWCLSATVAFTIMNLTEVALQTEQAWMSFFFLWSLSSLRETA